MTGSTRAPASIFLHDADEVPGVKFTPEILLRPSFGPEAKLGFV